MTEYEAQCRIGRDDRIVARRDNSSVELAGYFGDYAGDAYLAPDAARTFARGILALADEIDGGGAEEAPALRRIPKVGDRVRVVRNGPSDGDDHIGQVGAIAAIDTHDNVYPYRVSFPDDSYGWWCTEVEYVDEPTDTRPKVGDRLRVTQNNPWACPVEVGDTITVTETRYDRGADSPDFVRFVDRIGWPWGIPLTAVEPVTDDLETLADWERDLIEGAEAPAEPAPSPFARYVDEAKRLLTDTDHTGADVIALARELSGRD